MGLATGKVGATTTLKTTTTTSHMMRLNTTRATVDENDNIHNRPRRRNRDRTKVRK